MEDKDRAPARPENPAVEREEKQKAGAEVAFWADNPQMHHKIELIIWSDFGNYSQTSLFMSKQETMRLIEELNSSVRELEAFEALADA